MLSLDFWKFTVDLVQNGSFGYRIALKTGRIPNQSPMDLQLILETQNHCKAPRDPRVVTVAMDSGKNRLRKAAPQKMAQRCPVVQRCPVTDKKYEYKSNN